MGKNSAISWTDHTFNPWWGCTEVSPACDDCYARRWAERCGYTNIWGPGHTIRELSDKNWGEPLKWDRDAYKDFGRPARVFCGSMCDIYEKHPVAEKLRPRLEITIQRTRNLQWLLLTKRGGLALREHERIIRLPNVMQGVTLEEQTYDWRVEFPWVEWLSVEPMLGPIDISRFSFLKWVVIGGESQQTPGKPPRETQEVWIRDLLQQCDDLGIAGHVKQTGDVLARKLGLKDKHGKDKSEWPEWLQRQDFPALSKEDKELRA